MNEGRVEIGQIRKELETLSGPTDLTPGAFLGLPAALRRFLWWVILERAVTLERVAAFLGQSDGEAEALVRELDSRGLVEQVPACGFPVYRVCLVPRRLQPPEELSRMLEPDPRGKVGRS
jgi:hypothetical protein